MRDGLELRELQPSDDDDSEDERLLRGQHGENKGKEGPAVQLSRRWFIGGLIASLAALVVCTALLITCRKAVIEECNPFLAPGFLDVDPNRAQNTRWRPLDEHACPSSHLFPRFAHMVQSNDGSAARSFPSLVGKTLLKIGDSVDRNHVHAFCSHFAQSVEIFYPGSTNSPPEWSGPDDRPRATGTLEKWSEARARRCRIESMDFELIFFFHFGKLRFSGLKLTRGRISDGQRIQHVRPCDHRHGTLPRTCTADGSHRSHRPSNA